MKSEIALKSGFGNIEVYPEVALRAIGREPQSSQRSHRILCQIESASQARRIEIKVRRRLTDCHRDESILVARRVARLIEAF
jgi:hypothetical protein